MAYHDLLSETIGDLQIENEKLKEALKILLDIVKDKLPDSNFTRFEKLLKSEGE
jgi:hypothetical protein